MQCLFTRNWHTQVQRLGAGQLLAATSYADTHRELSAQLIVDVQSFVINDAIWECHRSPIDTGEKEVHRITKLHGTQAYFNSGPALRDSLKVLQEKLAVPLFAETVKGIIQAETFLWHERGYSSCEVYNSHWEDFYAGSCRYYSNLDLVSQTWGEYVSRDKREGNLFARFKNQVLYADKEQYHLMGSLSDSFHELQVMIEVAKRGVEVKSASGVLLRTPDMVCRESNIFLSNLVGHKLNQLRKKEIAASLGASQGCVHLIDVVDDLAQTLEVFEST